MTKEREGELLMVAIAFLESWFPILSIISMSYTGALHTYAFSLIVALFFFLVLMVKRGRFKELKNKSAYKDLLLTTFFITLLFTLVFIGMQYTTAGNMAVIIFLQLLFSFLYFNVLGKEKMDTLHIAGAIIIGIGAIIILTPNELNFNKGDLLILAAAAISPFANLYQKRARVFCSAETILGFRTIIGLPFVMLLAWYFEDAVEYELFLEAVPYVLSIGILIYVVSKIMWIEALHRISITKMSAMLAMVPVFTLCFASITLGETPQTHQIIAIIPVIIGGYLLTKPIKSSF